MEPEHIVKFLSTVPLFHDSTEEQLRGLAESVQTHTHESGDVVPPEMGVGRALFIVVQGEYQVMLSEPNMDLSVEVARLYPGDYFGDLALISNQGPVPKIRAVEPGMVLCLPKERFDESFASSPEFARKVCRSLAGYVAQTYSRMGLVPFVQLSRCANLEETVHMLPARICRTCKCLVVDRDGPELKVALVDPTNSDNRAFISQVLRPYDIHWVAMGEDDFDVYAGRYLTDDKTRRDPFFRFERLAYTNPSGEVAMVEGFERDELLARILTQAIHRRASDIHLEPGFEAANLRFRIDGRMVPIEEEISKTDFRHLITQIKVMAELDITRGHQPRDGSFGLQADDQRFDVRVATVPCYGGEKAVLRIVSPNPHFSRLENLIQDPALARLAGDLFDAPSGLVLVTGPTGSGKTTTLYAGLNSLWRSDQSINVVTMEDPVEYDLPFATQVPVHTDLGMTFARILKAVLRQDPDVILVGEIRDAESANMALEAATTGHLVLTSLHTHSAFESIVRLRQLNVKPYLLADALRGVISQQLVPRIRPGMSEPVPDDNPIYGRLQALGILPADFDGELHQPRSISSSSDEDLDEDDPEQGRVGVFEVLGVTDKLRDGIERERPAGELRALTEPHLYTSFAQYCRYLLSRRLVAPQRLERLFSRLDTAMPPEAREPKPEFAAT